jgi:uncharacterized protein (DUF2384 family)
VTGKGDHISCAVFRPFRALEKEEGIDLIISPMGIELQALKQSVMSQKTHNY